MMRFWGLYIFYPGVSTNLFERGLSSRFGYITAFFQLFLLWFRHLNQMAG